MNWPVFRSLRNSPIFTSVAVISLALGVGANTAVFSLLNQALLRSLPVKNPSELVQLKEDGEFQGSNSGMNAFSYPMYKDLKEQNQVFSGMLCREQTAVSVASDGRNERASGEVVSGTYFDVLGVQPVRGRTFHPSDDQIRGGEPYAVLSYDYWMNRFGGDDSVIGRQMLVNNHQFTVVGVAQKGFDGVDPMFPTQVFLPVMMAVEIAQESKPFDNHFRRFLQVFGRLKPGLTQEQASAGLAPLFHRLIEDEVAEKEMAQLSAYAREHFLRMKLKVMPGRSGQSYARTYLAGPLWAMMAMVGLVLLIACANVANLMIARAASRQKEIAVRLAVGASRWQIIRQLLLESGLIALAGGLLGLSLARLSLGLLTNVIPQSDPPLKLEVTPDVQVLLFTLGICAVTVLLFGLLPALQATRPDLAPTLKDQGNAVAGGGQAAWRKGLVCVQVGLSLLLLISAGMFVGTLRNLRSLSPGFEVTNLLAFSLDPTLNGYDKDHAKLFYRQLNASLQSLPGVRSAALCVVTPLNFDEWDNSVKIEGYTARTGEDVSAYMNYVSPGFFETLKIPVFAGRAFSDRDDSSAPKVAVVNEKFARRYFGRSNPIGRHLGMGGGPGSKLDIEIVGVVRDMKYDTMRNDPPKEVFIPYQQAEFATQMTAFVRTDLPSDQMFSALRAAVKRQDSNLPIYQMKTEERQLDDVLAPERLAASLSTTFGVLAAALAAIGLYGVMAFLVTRRTREIGVRMALGANRTDVVWIVLREVLLLVGIGVAVGLPAALAVCNLMREQLYGMSPFNVPTIIIATIGILLVAAVSGYLPALRATRVDPLTALRYE